MSGVRALSRARLRKLDQFKSSGVLSMEHLTERQAEIFRLSVVNRLSQTAIAARLGIAQQTVSETLAIAREKLPPVDADAMREASRQLQQDIQRRALELAEMIGAPVTSGKDGGIVYDTDGTVVRDYALRLQALELARKADVELRKLDGLDAASKTEVSGSVRYEVAGVDVSKLS